MVDFSEYLDVLDESPFAETPVDLDTFLGPEYLNQPPLSSIQRDLVESMSQIYEVEDLQRIMGEQRGREFHKKYTKNEIILAVGKASGKDFTSTLATAYIVYKLLCLKDPAKYFGKPPGDAIDIINIAINAEQARNVFFKRFARLIEKCPWFQGKYRPTQTAIEFSKSVTVYSGHSERESHEGLNLILAILDEISGFALESNSVNGKTADAIYKMFRASVDSRFDKIGKVVLLSFPRFKGDYISQRYESVVLEKEISKFEHTFVINEDLPPETDNNTFTIRWEEETVKSYKVSGVFALKAPTWRVNPTKTIESFKRNFLTDPGDALQRFACIGQNITDVFIKNPEALKDAFVIRNPLDDRMRIDESWTPNPEYQYFLHADLAEKRDRSAIAVAHVNRWQSIKVYEGYEVLVPEVVVDMVAYWTPQPGQPIDLKDTVNWVKQLQRRGCHIKLMTFDRWAPLAIQMEYNQAGIQTENLSVALKHYDDLAMAIYEKRVKFPAIDILHTELSELKVVSKTQVDHPRAGGKDLSDAVTGAVYNAITRTPKANSGIVDVVDWSSVRSRMNEPEVPEVQKKPDMPKDVADYLEMMGAI